VHVVAVPPALFELSGQDWHEPSAKYLFAGQSPLHESLASEACGIREPPDFTVPSGHDSHDHEPPPPLLHSAYSLSGHLHAVDAASVLVESSGHATQYFNSAASGSSTR
jgi:hypothetical protein